MGKKKFSYSNQWEYVPNKSFGTANFDGLPCPSARAYELLGDEDLKHIDDKIKQLKKNKEELFGKNSELVGFDAFQLFIKNKVGEIITCHRGAFRNDIEYAFPERKSLENYIVTVMTEVRDVLLDFKTEYGHIKYTNDYIQEQEESRQLWGNLPK